MKTLLFFGMLLSSGIIFGQEDTCFIYIPDNVSMHCDQAGMDFLLFVQHNCPFGEAHFLVFDRWGEILHDSHELEPEFDASELKVGTYSYILDVKYRDLPVGMQEGRKQRVEGNFTVLR